jgi:hypothetical protein
MQRRSIWVTFLFGVAIVVTALNHTRKVHATSCPDRQSGCSVASLKGTYAGVNNDVGGPIAEIGIEVFNGDGTRGILRSTRSTNGEIQDRTDFPWPSGSYTVDPDGTGSLFAADDTKQNNFIVLDGGKRFSLLSVLHSSSSLS